MTDTPLRPLTTSQKYLIAFGSLAMGVGMTINFVVVAPLARQAGLTEIQVAGILTLSTLLYAALIPYWGRLADKFGRKRVMVFSLFAMGAMNMAFLFALSAALAGVVTGLAAFLLLAFVRLWFGVLSPGLQPASMAAMTDATTAKDRAVGLGLLGAAMALGSIIGPASAALLAPFGALMPIWGSIVLCWATALLIGFALPKTRERAPGKGRPVPLKMTDPRVAPHLLFLLIYFMAVAMIQQTLGWFIEDRYAFVDTDLRTAKEAAVLYTGIAFSALSIGFVAVQFGYVQPRKPSSPHILPVGLFLVGTGYLIAVSVHPFWALCVGFLVTGAGSGLVVPAANALGSLSVPPEDQGSAAALLSAAPPAGFIFGPLLGAILYTFGKYLPLIASAVVMLSLGVYAIMMLRRAGVASAAARPAIDL